MPAAQKIPQVIGVVGTGLMGRGIAQVAAQAGIRTLMFDARAGAAGAARDTVRSQLQKVVEKAKMEARALEATLARMEPVAALADLAPCEVVIEAIVEDLAAKQELFRALEAIVGDQCVIASNTSSLQVTAIASACQRPGRVGGFHFFSPVPLMKVVEVVQGARTQPWVGEKLAELARHMGHAPVLAKDTPGFIVNHAGRGYGTEALRLLSEGIAEHHEIDRILKEAAGFRMGPFELLDLTGLDVSHPVMESIYRQFYDEPRFRPTPLLGQRRAAGLLGRKTGEGFYRYGDAGMVPVPPPAPSTHKPARVWLSRANPEAHERVVPVIHKLGVPLETAERPSQEALSVLLPWDRDATTAALDEELDPMRCVALDAHFGLDSHRTVMTTPVTAPEWREAARGLFAGDGVAVSVVHDSVGFVAPRVVAHIVNIACDIAQQRIASPADIDRAVTLGLGYRKGPLAMGDAMGPAKVLSLLAGMQAFYGDPRYRPSPWLTRRARLGVSLATPEN